MTMGGVALGAAVMGLITPRAPSNDILNDLIKDKPEFYKFIDIDLSTARTDQPYDEPGTFIWVDNQFARGEVTLRLNELKFGKFDLRRQKYISGPFYRFFITNGVGQGNIRLFISRGYQAASEPIEAINMAELAARLGSIVSFDRWGDVIWLDNFSGGLAEWELESWGLGRAIAMSAVTARSGGFSCKLTAGSDDEHAAAISHYLPTPVLSKIGCEFSFTYSNPFNFLGLDCILNYPGYILTALIKYERETMTLQYRDKGAIWRDIARPVQFHLNDHLFNTMKLVTDAKAETYERLLVNDTLYPLTDIPLEKTFVASIPRGMMTIYLKGREDENDIMYIDDVIITQNEP